MRTVGVHSVTYAVLALDHPRASPTPSFDARITVTDEENGRLLREVCQIFAECDFEIDGLFGEIVAASRKS
jgi:hypothetical protein